MPPKREDSAAVKERVYGAPGRPDCTVTVSALALSTESYCTCTRMPALPREATDPDGIGMAALT